MPHPDRTGPSPRACLACRSRHLRCDGKTPICSRCLASGSECILTLSRRGYNDSRKRKNAVQRTRRIEDAAAIPTQVQDNLPCIPSEPLSPPGTSQYSFNEASMAIPVIETDDAEEDYLMEVYYQYIHPAHPFVIPRMMYLRDQSFLPDHVKRVMRLIASHISSRDPEEFRQRVDILDNQLINQDGFKVQSLTLFALASFARFERDDGQRALMEALELAKSIGIDSDKFSHGQTPILQESWRRTWWELYTLTGLVSLTTSTPLRLGIASQLSLPGHCEDYNSCQSTPQPRKMEEMQDRFFAEDDDYEWSSFAYKIEAVRILRTVLEADNEAGLANESRVSALDASIASFLLSLPAHKRRSGKKASNSNSASDNQNDEVMSSALMTIHLANICLHLPRSGLSNLRRLRSNTCGTERSRIPAGNTMIMTKDQTHHAASSALKSANALSHLILSQQTSTSSSTSGSGSLRTLTPCFSCAIMFGASVYLAAYILDWDQGSGSNSNSSSGGGISSCRENSREHIQLLVSALKEIGQTWPIARVVRGQLAQFAREVLGRTPPVVASKIVDKERLAPMESIMSLDFGMDGNGDGDGEESWLREFINQGGGGVEYANGLVSSWVS